MAATAKEVQTAYNIISNLFRLREVYVHDEFPDIQTILVVGQDTENAKKVLSKAGFVENHRRQMVRGEIKVDMSVTRDADCTMFSVTT